MTASTGTIGTQVSAGVAKAMGDVLIPALQAGIPTLMAKSPKLSGVTAVATRGSASNPLTLMLGLNETIAEFISELLKTSGKTARVGAWNENILPPCMKICYEAVHDVNSLLTCDVINTVYIYEADDGATGSAVGTPLAPINHASRTYCYPCMSGTLIDHDGKLLQPNFNPEGFLKTASRLQNVRGNLLCVWHWQLRDEAFDHGLNMPPYEFFHKKTPSNYITCGNGPDDVLPSHCSGLVARWSACLATFLRRPNTPPETHPAKKTILSMDTGNAMFVPAVRDMHP
jgi:hypothetical protein